MNWLHFTAADFSLPQCFSSSWADGLLLVKSQHVCVVKCHFLAFKSCEKLLVWVWCQSSFTFSDLCCLLLFSQEKYGLGTRLQRPRPGVPISSLSGLSWVAFYSHKHCSIEWLCWHRRMDLLPCSMSWTSILSNLETCLDTFIHNSSASPLFISVFHQRDAFKDTAQYGKINNLLTNDT